jgi:hypothetical protein
VDEVGSWHSKQLGAYNKIIHKVRQTWHQEPVFGPFMGHNFKDSTEK